MKTRFEILKETLEANGFSDSHYMGADTYAALDKNGKRRTMRDDWDRITIFKIDFQIEVKND